MYDKKQAIINEWLKFSKVESRNIQAFVNYASYYYNTSKEYVRSVIADYNLAENQKKRQEQEKELEEVKKMLKEIEKEL